MAGRKLNYHVNHPPSQRKQDGDIRYGFRLSNGESVMSLETEQERTTRIERERFEDNQNRVFETAAHLRRVREATAKQGTLDLPDHW